MAPSASSTLVNVAEDAETRLVRLLAETGNLPANFVQQCDECISLGNAEQLMRTILAQPGSMDAILTLPEATSVFSLLAALLDRIPSSNVTPLVEEMAKKIVAAKNATETQPADGDDTATGASAVAVSKPIALLATLYNMRTSFSEKVGLLVQMITLASQRQPALLEPHAVLGKWLDATKLSTMMDEWKIAPVQRRQVYKAASLAAKGPTAKQRLSLLLVQTYTTSKEVDAAGLASARDTAIGAVRDPVSLFVEQRNILQLVAVQALQKSDAPLLALLTVFQEGKLQEYHDFVKANGGDAAVTKYGLDPTACVKQMRILSLCSLAAEHEEIPYAVVSKTLQLDSSSDAAISSKIVEQWVIAAVSSGLLSAKMDQLQEKVMVERCVVRKFDMEQWKVLQARLKTWKQNVGGILDAYKQSQASLVSPAAGN